MVSAVERQEAEAESEGVGASCTTRQGEEALNIQSTPNDVIVI